MKKLLTRLISILKNKLTCRSEEITIEKKTEPPNEKEFDYARHLDNKAEYGLDDWIDSEK